MGAACAPAIGCGSPFAETAEQIAGIGIIEVDNLDQALDWAAGHPDSEWASVEVRPIVPWKEGAK